MCVHANPLDTMYQTINNLHGLTMHGSAQVDKNNIGNKLGLKCKLNIPTVVRYVVVGRELGGMVFLVR